MWHTYYTHVKIPLSPCSQQAQPNSFYLHTHDTYVKPMWLIHDTHVKPMWHTYYTHVEIPLSPRRLQAQPNYFYLRSIVNLVPESAEVHRFLDNFTIRWELFGIDRHQKWPSFLFFIQFSHHLPAETTTTNEILTLFYLGWVNWSPLPTLSCLSPARKLWIKEVEVLRSYYTAKLLFELLRSSFVVAS